MSTSKKKASDGKAGDEMWGIDAVQAMYEKFIKGNPAAERRVAKLDIDFRVASQIYKLRTEAKLTQSELAKLIGTTPSVISRLEDAEYASHSVSMLKRIADALGKRVEIRFVTLPRIVNKAKPRRQPLKIAKPRRKPAKAPTRKRKTAAAA